MRNVSRILSLRGEDVDLWRDEGTTTNEFGKDVDSWIEIGTIRTLRSYPNRNTTLDENDGPLQRDRPVFFFHPDSAVQSEDRIDYRGTFYDLESPTRYDSHIAIMANAVTGFSP